jgi:hypothetical protein
MTFHRPFHRSPSPSIAYSIGYSIAPANAFHRPFHRGFPIPPHPYGDRRARRGLEGLALHRRHGRKGRERTPCRPAPRNLQNRNASGADRARSVASPSKCDTSRVMPAPVTVMRRRNKLLTALLALVAHSRQRSLPTQRPHVRTPAGGMADFTALSAIGSMMADHGKGIYARVAAASSTLVERKTRTRDAIRWVLFETLPCEWPFVDIIEEKTGDRHAGGPILLAGEIIDVFSVSRAGSEIFGGSSEKTSVYK